MLAHLRDLCFRFKMFQKCKDKPAGTDYRDVLLNRGRPPLVDARVQELIEFKVASQRASKNCVTEGSSDCGVNIDDMMLKEVNKDRLRKNLRLVPVSKSTMSRCKAVCRTQAVQCCNAWRQKKFARDLQKRRETMNLEKLRRRTGVLRLRRHFSLR